MSDTEDKRPPVNVGDIQEAHFHITVNLTAEDGEDSFCISREELIKLLTRVQGERQ